MAIIDTVKILRLMTGEDVITQCNLINEHYFVENPMTIMFKHTDNGFMMMMMPWVPFEVITDNTICIEDSRVLTVLSPKRELIDYYHKMIDHDRKHREASEQSFLESLENQGNEEEQEDDEDDLPEEVLKTSNKLQKLYH